MDETPGGKHSIAVKWLPIEPAETSAQPFTLEAYSVRVPAKETVSVKVVYDSNEIREFNSVVTCTPRFESHEDGHAMDLGQLSVLLRSRTLRPALSLHMKVSCR